MKYDLQYEIWYTTSDMYCIVYDNLQYNNPLQVVPPLMGSSVSASVAAGPSSVSGWISRTMIENSITDITVHISSYWNNVGCYNVHAITVDSVWECWVWGCALLAADPSAHPTNSLSKLLQGSSVHGSATVTRAMKFTMRWRQWHLKYNNT